MQCYKEANIANGQAIPYPSSSAHSCVLGLSACLHTKLSDLKKADLEVPSSLKKIIFFIYISMYIQIHTRTHIYMCERERGPTER